MNYLSTIEIENTGKKAKRQMKAKCKLIINKHTAQAKHKCTPQHAECCTVQ